MLEANLLSIVGLSVQLLIVIYQKEVGGGGVPLWPHTTVARARHTRSTITCITNCSWHLTHCCPIEIIGHIFVIVLFCFLILCFSHTRFVSHTRRPHTHRGLSYICRNSSTSVTWPLDHLHLAGHLCQPITSTSPLLEMNTIFYLAYTGISPEP